MNIPKRLSEPKIGNNLSNKKYFEYSDYAGNASSHKVILSFANENIVSPQNLIDVCGGEGSFANAFKKNFPECEVSVLDIDNCPIKIGKRKYPYINFIQSSIYSPPDQLKEKFDVVSCIDAIHELDDLSGAINNMGSMLVDKGLLLISDFNREYLCREPYVNDKAYNKIRRDRDRYGEKSYSENFIFINRDVLRGRDLFWFSFQASYTSEEVISALRDNGFKLERRKDFLRGTRYLARKIK